MRKMNPTTRRSFLKKTVATTSVVGGVLASADPAVAASTTLSVYGYSGGSYEIVVNDGSVSAGSNVESGDEIKSGQPSSGYTTLTGYVGSDERDTFYFDGRATEIWLDGDLEVNIDNPTMPASKPDVVVTGQPTDYGFTMNDSVVSTNDCESNDDVNYDTNTVNGTISTSSDTDTYATSGVISYATVLNDGYVKMVQK